MARRSGLGRGLDAILPPERAPSPGVAEEPVPGTGGDGSVDEPSPMGPAPSGREVSKLVVSAIRPNPRQPRQVFDDAAIDELSRSIEALGVLQPVLVRPSDDGYELIAGERRWRAAARAGLTEIPALIRPTDDRGALEQAVVENVQRAELNALEEAAAYQQLVTDFGLTQEEVAERVGKSRSAVANTVRLLGLDPEVQRLVLDGELSAGHGRALLAIDDPDERLHLAQQAVARGWSVRQLEAAVRRTTPPEEQESAEPGTTKPAALLELEQLLADRLSTRVRVELGRRKGRIEIEFADLEDLERIFLTIS